VERYAKAGANVKFVGHPLVKIVKPTMTRAQFADRFGLEACKPIVGLLPGSRRYEIECNTPAMVEASKRIRAAVPGAQFVFGISANTPRETVEKWLAAADETDVTERRPGGAVAAITGKIAGFGEKLTGSTEQKLVTPEGVQVPAS